MILISMLYFVSVLKGMDLSDLIIQFHNLTDDETEPQRREMTKIHSSVKAGIITILLIL